MRPQKRIVIAEDHTIIREGLKALLTMDPNFLVVGEAKDGREAVQCIGNTKPDILLIDLSMPKMSGIDAIKEIKRRFPAVKILVLTVHEEEEYIHETLQSGADGYVLKDSSYNELERAIKIVLMGKPFLSPNVSEKVIEGYLEGQKSDRQTSRLDSLSQREREVLKLIAEGFKTREIADNLCISLRTAETHRRNLMKKLRIKNIAALTVYAMEKGLISVKTEG
jgi:DNA-binding NarL/FixJ family response regulator